jgi:hypothetical protein
VSIPEFTLRVSREPSGRYLADYVAITPVGTVSGGTGRDYATVLDAVGDVLEHIRYLARAQQLEDSILQRVTIRLSVTP